MVSVAKQLNEILSIYTLYIVWPPCDSINKRIAACALPKSVRTAFTVMPLWHIIADGVR